MFRFAQHDKLQISSRVLLALDGFEQRFEIAFAEALRAFALNDFEKECRAIFHRLGENLEQITFIIAIDEDAELASAHSVLRQCDRRDRAACHNKSKAPSGTRARASEVSVTVSMMLFVAIAMCCTPSPS